MHSSILYKWVKNNSSSSVGGQTLLNEKEEELLVKYIFLRHRCMRPLDNQELRVEVGRMLTPKRKKDFKLHGGIPGEFLGKREKKVFVWLKSYCTLFPAFLMETVNANRIRHLLSKLHPNFL